MTHRTFTAALAASLAIGIVAGCGQREAYEKPPIPVQVAEVRRQPLGSPLRYSAAVEPAIRVDLAFRVGGYVTSLAQVGGRVLQDGDPVKVGTVLASVRPDDYEAKVAQAQAAVAEGEAARGASDLALARAEALFKARSLTRPELEQARAMAASVEAKIAGARAVVREAELARGDAALRAPIGGIVLKRLVEVGSLVGPGTPAFVLADPRTVKVVIGIPDTMLPRFPTGATERIATEAFPDRRFEGRVTKISPTADPQSRLFEVELTVSNADGALKPGMVATVDVPPDVASPASAAPADALVVPLSAVVRALGEGENYAVFVVEDVQGVPTARLRRVRLGRLLGNAITVDDGLSAGERVIVQGAAMVADGDRLNPTR